MIGITDYLRVKEEKVVFQMLSQRPSEVIIAGLEHSDTSRSMIEASDISIVEIMDVDGTPIDYAVGIWHIREGRKMGEEIMKVWL